MQGDRGLLGRGNEEEMTYMTAQVGPPDNATRQYDLRIGSKDEKIVRPEVYVPTYPAPTVWCQP
jgi:hypothetical protein